MSLNTYEDISPRTRGKAVARLLKRGQHDMVAERFGQIDPQPKKSTKTRKYRRYHSLPRATAPLAEGVPPAGQKLSYTDVNITLEQYGDVVWITDVIADTHEDPVLQESMDLCGEQAAETIEAIRISYLKGGTNVFYAAGVASRSLVNSPPTRGDFRKIYRYFKKHKAREISKIIKASAMVSTEPVKQGYFVMGHTDASADLRDIPGFVSVEQYSNSDKSLPNEAGKLEEFRFILTAMFDPWEAAGVAGTTYLSSGAEVSSNTACDVYPMIVVAKDAYAIVPLQGYESVDIGVVNPGKKTTDQPLGQKGFVSWITWQGGGILNQQWIARLEHAVTANPN
jgi:N4-gp56 family major capsid protein